MRVLQGKADRLQQHDMGNVEIVAVVGPKGSGKTRLLSELHSHVMTSSTSTTAIGLARFEQYPPPYLRQECALLRTVAALCDELLCHTHHEALRRQKTLRAALLQACVAPEITALLQEFPRLQRYVLPIPEGHDEPLVRTKLWEERLHTAVLVLLQTLLLSTVPTTTTTTAGPMDNSHNGGLAPKHQSLHSTSTSPSGIKLILQLDDVDCAGESTLALLEKIVDPCNRLRNLLIVSTVTSTLPSSLSSSSTKRTTSSNDNSRPKSTSYSLPTFFYRSSDTAATTLSIVELSNFTEPQLNKLVATLTIRPIHQSSPLTALLYAKSDGNPFCSLQILKSLVQNGLLVYKLGAARWHWDLSLVRTAVYRFSLDNMLDLFAARMAQQSRSVVLFMKAASSMGLGFDVRIVKLILKLLDPVQSLSIGSTNSESIETMIEAASANGLIEAFTPVLTTTGMSTASSSSSSSPPHQKQRRRQSRLSEQQQQQQRYGFTHMHVRHAAYMMVAHRSRVHACIGRFLQQQLQRQDQEQRKDPPLPRQVVCVMADQLNLGAEHLPKVSSTTSTLPSISTIYNNNNSSNNGGSTTNTARMDEQRHAQLEHARRNLQAGAFAMQQNKWAIAADYFVIGTGLLPNASVGTVQHNNNNNNTDHVHDDNHHDDSWVHHYETRVGIAHQLIESELRAGHFESCHQLIKTSLKKMRSVRDSHRLYELKLEALCTQHRLQECLHVGILYLRRHAVKVPLTVHKVHTWVRRLKTISKVQGRTNQDGLLSLRPVMDSTKESSLQLLYQLSHVAAMRHDTNLYLVLILQHVSMCLKHGVAVSTGATLIACGALIARLLPNQHDEGLRLAITALNDVGNCLGVGSDQYRQYKLLAGLQYIQSFGHLRDTTNESVLSLRRCYTAAVGMGQPIAAQRCAELYVTIRFHESAGGPLDRLLADVRALLADVADRHGSSPVLQLYHNTILSLVGDTRAATTPLILNSRKDVDLEQSGSPVVLQAMWLLKLLLSLYYQGTYATVETLSRLNGNDGANSSAYHTPFLAWAKATAVMSMQSNHRQGYNKRVCARVIRKAEKWSRVCRPQHSHQHRLLLLQAQHAALRHAVDAPHRFDVAVQAAEESGVLCDAAYANELAGCYCNNEGGLERQGKTYLRTAYRYYQQWGAKTKLVHMKKTYDLRVTL